MEQRVEAIYENGVFRPLKSPNMSDGQQVELIVEPSFRSSIETLLAIAKQRRDAQVAWPTPLTGSRDDDQGKLIRSWNTAISLLQGMF